MSNKEEEAEFRARFEQEHPSEENQQFAARLAAEQAKARSELHNPVLWSVLGVPAAAAAGSAAKSFGSAKVDELIARYHVPPEVVARGDNAVINYVNSQFSGDIKYVGGKHYKEGYANTLAALEKDKLSPPGQRYDPFANEYVPQEEFDKRMAAKVAAEQKKLSPLTRLAQRSPAAAQTMAGMRGVMQGTVPAWAGRTAVGAYGGYNAAEALNRLNQGDVPGSAISGLGTTGAALSLSPNPKARALGIGLMGTSYLGNKLYTSPTFEPPGGIEALQTVKSKVLPQPQADGGSIKGYARGEKVIADMVVGKSPAGLDIVKKIFRGTPEQTVLNPLRMDYPGIYERPDIIAQKAAQNVAPESPYLKQLFGVTRNDLYEMSKRQGNMPGVIPGAAKNPKGSAAAESIMVPQNEQRIIDTLSELRSRAPGMYQGMHGWYVMDPAYQRLVQLVGKDEAGRLYRQLNVFGGIESPNMPVPNEFRRASAAHMLAEQGRFPDWQKYGGLKALEKASTPGYPADLMSVPGRVGHQRASSSQEKYLRTGQHGMDSPKAPPYIEASSVPELGFQTDIPVGDAHWSRGVGLADVRTGKSTAESVSTPEIQQLSPWWRDKIAAQMGTESVPAQGILWGGLGHATGVKTKVGAPKLELWADQIVDAANRLNVSPETARDLILMGKERAGRQEGGPV